MLDAWAIIKSRQSRPLGGFGGWRLTPPGKLKVHLRAGWGTPHPSASLTPVSLRVGRSADLTGHRPVIQHREPPGGRLTEACHSTPRNPRGKAILSRCAATPHPSRLRRATCLPAGRSVRGSDTPPACHSTPRTPRGEGFGRVAFSTAPLKGKANEDVSFDDISLVNGWYADLLCQHLDIPVAFRDTFW